MYFIFKYSSMKKLWIALFAIFAITVAWCTTQTSESSWPTSVTLWVISPLSWPASTIGEDQIKIYQDAVENFNTSQDKYKVNLVTEDGKCAAKDAVSAYQKLTSVDGVSIILGWVCSSETIAAWQIAEGQDVIILSALSSSPDISSLSNVFRFRNDLDSSKTMAEYFAQNNINNVAIIYENADYPAGYIDAFKSQFKWNIVSEQKYNPDEKDFSIVASNIKNDLSEIDMLVVIPSADTPFISIMKALKSEWILWQLQNKIIWADTLYSESVVSELGQDLEWVYSIQFPNLFESNDKSKSFGQQFQSKYNYTIQWPWFFSFSKEAVDLVLDAIKDGNTTASDIKSYLGNITAKNKRSGYIGDYYFDENGDGQWLEFVVNQVVDGKLVPLE